MPTLGNGSLIATIIPLAMLFWVAFIGRGGRQTALLVAVAVAWGMAATWIVLPFNNRFAAAYGVTAVIVYGGPLQEEIVKALILPFLTISKRVFWFVDGAILGLASGTGFAIRENWLYLANSRGDASLELAIARVSSTNLMHAGTTAIVGAALVLTLRRNPMVCIGVGLGALTIAVTLHSLFNRLTTNPGESAAVITLVGMAVFGIAAGIVALGIPLSKSWLRKDLEARGASESEMMVLAGGRSVNAVLDEFERRYGSAATQKAEELIKLQRRLAIARNSQAKRLNATQLQELEQGADELRRQIGVFAMMWLRTHLPTDADAASMWSSLDALTTDEVSGTDDKPGGLWERLS
ncbi:unannotated protein [freshwater metagenome]|uniref:Unannotated protein n=1 Tax=freshwater metagenome TaxID=449393 RepID=A0A6J7CNM2_9ZZZZ|nr:PrsW family intramembrane metalloprotease [Actinomycetota bacterium]